MSKHPSYYFVKYLLTLGIAESNDPSWVKGTVQAHDLYPIEEGAVRSIREETIADMPADYRPRDRNHNPSALYQKRHKIFLMHHPNEQMRIMRDYILLSPLGRELVERMLLGRLDVDFIASRLNKRFDLVLTSKAVDLYRHFYFNTDLMTVDDWVTMFYSCADKDSAKVKSAIARVGAPLALYRTGIRQTIDTKDTIKKAQQMLFMTLLEIDQLPLSVSKVQMLVQTSRALLAVDERLSQSDMALSEVLQEFKKFSAKRAGVGPSSIKELAPDGAYSGSGRMLGPGKGKNVNEGGKTNGKRSRSKQRA